MAITRTFLFPRCVLPLCGALLFILAAAAQQVSISGTVRDIQKLPIPDVSITLTTGNQAGQRRATTDAQGTFLIEGLTAGSYRLVYERAGFSTVTRSGT